MGTSFVAFEQVKSALIRGRCQPDGHTLKPLDGGTTLVAVLP
jgi:hypothetical protein